MLAPFMSRPKIFNTKLHDYCLKSTNDSVRRMIENREKERKFKNIDLSYLLKDSNSSNPDNNNNNNIIVPFVFILSISSIIYYFYNYKK